MASCLCLVWTSALSSYPIQINAESWQSQSSSSSIIVRCSLLNRVSLFRNFWGNLWICCSWFMLSLTSRTVFWSGCPRFCMPLLSVLLDTNLFYIRWELRRSIWPWCPFGWDGDLQRRVDYPSKQNIIVVVRWDIGKAKGKYHLQWLFAIDGNWSMENYRRIKPKAAKQGPYKWGPC